MIKNPSANAGDIRDGWGRGGGPSLGQEDPLEGDMAKTSILLLGESHGQRCLAGYSPKGCKELDMTEVT